MKTFQEFLIEAKLIPGTQPWTDFINLVKSGKDPNRTKDMSAELLYNTCQNITKKYFKQFINDVGAKFKNPKFEKEINRASLK